MRFVLVLFVFLIPLALSNPQPTRTFPCVVMNHYTPQEFVECDTQCYTIKVHTLNEIRTIRRGCAGKDDLIERARFELEHKLVFTTTDCRKVGSGTLREDGELTLTQRCCTGAFCNSSASSSLLLSLLLSLIAFCIQ